MSFDSKFGAKYDFFMQNSTLSPNSILSFNIFLTETKYCELYEWRPKASYEKQWRRSIKSTIRIKLLSDCFHLKQDYYCMYFFPGISVNELCEYIIWLLFYRKGHLINCLYGGEPIIAHCRDSVETLNSNIKMIFKFRTNMMLIHKLARIRVTLSNTNFKKLF